MQSKESITVQSTIQRNPEMISSDMDGETVMMSVENGEYYGLNPIGSRIWELIENEKNVNTIINTLLLEYEVSIEQCTSETLIFLNKLLDNNLIIIK